MTDEQPSTEPEAEAKAESQAKDESQASAESQSQATSNTDSAQDESLMPEDTRSGAALNRVNPERSLQLALAAAVSAAENGGTDIVVMDMSEHTAIFDYFVIATGTSRRQLHAMSEEIDHKLEDELNDKRMSIDGYSESRWIVLDYGTVVIHLFDDETRKFYSLEALWADARKVDLTDTLKDIKF